MSSFTKPSTELEAKLANYEKKFEKIKEQADVDELKTFLEKYRKDEDILSLMAKYRTGSPRMYDIGGLERLYGLESLIYTEIWNRENPRGKNFSENDEKRRIIDFIESMCKLHEDSPFFRLIAAAKVARASYLSPEDLSRRMTI